MTTKKGFTLIELLIVIAIIGILSSVILVNMSGVRARAKDAAALQAGTQLAKAVAMCTMSGGNVLAPIQGNNICNPAGNYGTYPEPPNGWTYWVAGDVPGYNYNNTAGTSAYVSMHANYYGNGSTHYLLCGYMPNQLTGSWCTTPSYPGLCRMANTPSCTMTDNSVVPTTYK